MIIKIARTTLTTGFIWLIFSLISCGGDPHPRNDVDISLKSLSLQLDGDYTLADGLPIGENSEREFPLTGTLPELMGLADPAAFDQFLVDSASEGFDRYQFDLLYRAMNEVTRKIREQLSGDISGVRTTIRQMIKALDDIDIVSTFENDNDIGGTFNYQIAQTISMPECIAGLDNCDVDIDVDVRFHFPTSLPSISKIPLSDRYLVRFENFRLELSKFKFRNGQALLDISSENDSAITFDLLEIELTPGQELSLLGSNTTVKNLTAAITGSFSNTYLGSQGNYKEYHIRSTAQGQIGLMELLSDMQTQLVNAQLTQADLAIKHTTSLGSEETINSSINISPIDNAVDCTPSGTPESLALLSEYTCYYAKSFSGLKYMTGLTKLSLLSNTFKSLDLSNQSQLQSLKVSQVPIDTLILPMDSQLTNLELLVTELNALDLSNQTQLTNLYSAYNPLSTIQLPLGNEGAEMELPPSNRLTEVKILGSKIREIDLSQSERLTTLAIENSQLREIDISANLLLKSLTLRQSEISNLILGNHSDLEHLFIDENALSHLDLGQTVNLLSLNANHNRLSNIDLSQNKKLEYLELKSNTLEQIDIGANSALKIVNLSSNHLTAIDTQLNLALSVLNIQDNVIGEINLDSNFNLKTLYINQTPLSTASKAYLMTLDTVTISFKEGVIQTPVDDVPSVFPNCVVKQTSPTGEILALYCDGLTGRETFINTPALKELTLVGEVTSNIDLSYNVELEKLIIQTKNGETHALTELNLSANTQLAYLTIQGGPLQKLTLPATSSLTYVNIRGNDLLTDLDLSQVPGLTDVQLKFLWALKGVDLSAQVHLVNLTLSGLILDELDLSNSPQLKSLTMYEMNEGNLDQLDLSANTALTDLILQDANVASLDFSQNTELVHLDIAANPITSLNLSANTQLQTVSLRYTALQTLTLPTATLIQELSIVAPQTPCAELLQGSEMNNFSCEDD